MHAIPALDSIVQRLCAQQDLLKILNNPCHEPMPSLEKLSEIMARLRAIIFPGFFGTAKVFLESMPYHMAANLDSIYRLLAEQITRGECFVCANESDCSHSRVSADEKAMAFLQSLPEIRQLLLSDAQAAYEGDPAATSPGEAIFCYPSIYTMIHQRIAHRLYELKVPVIPRMITEMAHSHTGIDIHPGATIGEEFFIDHGTGVVIGETCIIGKGCRLYQGVTLGALSFPKDDQGILVKGIDRHPILENNVTVYAGATILGRITIGEGALIGGNVWVTHDVPRGGKIVQQRGAKADAQEKMVGNIV